MNATIPFDQVEPGEEFESREGTRHFFGMKVQEISMMATTGPDRGTLIEVNAVITRDHTRKRTSDAGAHIYINPRERVIVSR